MKLQIVERPAIIRGSKEDGYMNLVHIAWDESYIAQVLSDKSGEPLYAGQDKTKTICLRTVPINSISNIEVTCPDCREAAKHLGIADDMLKVALARTG